MSQEDFRERHRKTWKRFQMMLDAMENKKRKIKIRNQEEFPALYRQICNHLDLARQRNYGSQLTDFLNKLALRGHQFFYEAKAGHVSRVKKLYMENIPRAIQKDWKLFAVGSLLFYGPFIFMFIFITIYPDMIYSVLDPYTVEQIKWMYEDKNFEDREFSDSITMLGHYVYNNTGIGLRTFGSSMILGVGSIFTLMFNGVYIGAVFALLKTENLVHNLGSFVVGHGSFELTAICVSGMAGLKLGFAFLIPKNRTRGESVKAMAKECIPLIYCFVTMFIIAAFIEAFWSPIPRHWIPDWVKYVVGGLLWAFVFFYFFFVGRRRVR